MDRRPADRGVLVATDAPLITSQFARLVPHRLRVLMEGEDLFNDATAIVVFGIFLHIAQHPWKTSRPPGRLPVLPDRLRRLVRRLAGRTRLLLRLRLFEDAIQQAMITLICLSIPRSSSPTRCSRHPASWPLITGLTMDG